MWELISGHSLNGREAGSESGTYLMSKFVLVFVLSFLAISSPSRAGANEDSVNGALIPEPTLNDYVQGSRTPGFSPIVDVVDQNGNSVH